MLSLKGRWVLWGVGSDTVYPTDTRDYSRWTPAAGRPWMNAGEKVYLPAARGLVGGTVTFTYMGK